MQGVGEVGPEDRPAVWLASRTLAAAKSAANQAPKTWGHNLRHRSATQFLESAPDASRKLLVGMSARTVNSAINFVSFSVCRLVPRRCSAPRKYNHTAFSAEKSLCNKCVNWATGWHGLPAGARGSQQAAGPVHPLSRPHGTRSLPRRALRARQHFLPRVNTGLGRQEKSAAKA